MEDQERLLQAVGVGQRRTDLIRFGLILGFPEPRLGVPRIVTIVIFPTRDRTQRRSARVLVGEEETHQRHEAAVASSVHSHARRVNIPQTPEIFKTAKLIVKIFPAKVEKDIRAVFPTEPLAS